MMRRVTLALIIIVSLLSIIVFSCNKDDDKNNQPPTCEITNPSTGQEITVGETVSVTVSAADTDGSIKEVLIYVNNEEKATIANTPYNYIWNTTDITKGTYTIKAVSFDNNGSSAEDEVTIFVTDGTSSNSPNTNFTANTTSGSSPFTVLFTDLSTNTPLSWEWHFGDNNTSTSQNPTHTFADDGYYTVSLIVSNHYGKDTLTKTNYIYVGNGGIDGEPCPGTPHVFDADGNMYNTVMIGSRCWMKENLRVGTFLISKYEMSNNGVIEKYCYNDSTPNCETYGALYQWDEIMQYTHDAGAQGICPDGWHIPSDDEWKQLEMHLGMSQDQADQVGYRGLDEGDKLKSETGWSNNGNGSNISNFSGVPGGYRHSGGSFRYLTETGSWWSSSEHRSIRVWRRGLYNNNDMVRRNHHDKSDGLSVRCVKN